MTNGDYDDNILLFERDVLLMLTNALCNYHRHDNIHGHAREMMDYALELFMVKNSILIFKRNKQLFILS